jgi:HEAT repeat protein
MRHPSMWATYIPKFLAAPVLLLSAVSAQMNDEPLETFAQGLERHYIQATRPALIDALRNPDKEVRVLAAAELAEMIDSDALPQITQAAHMEQDPVTQMRIAAAASWLGSRKGLNGVD